jgi:hypothetical protein
LAALKLLGYQIALRHALAIALWLRKGSAFIRLHIVALHAFTNSVQTAEIQLRALP